MPVKEGLRLFYIPEILTQGGKLVVLNPDLQSLFQNTWES